mmetsp:Transcript_9954/g.42053  ORF Transcript_9954/g.42053 Transcript_9954/m.42053 type:complete len:510 (-) Transcript_9954:1244-2773(-)
MAMTKQQQLQGFEAELIQLDNSPDPLHTWISYISWARSALQKDQIVQLLERCIGKFIGESRYLEDARFVRLCVTHADALGDYHAAEEALRKSRTAGVGSRSALIYEAHAIVLEKLRAFAKAETVYAEGKSNEAQPLKRLEQRWEEFRGRMKRRVERQRKHESRSVHRKALSSVEKNAAPIEPSPPPQKVRKRGEEDKPISRKLAFGTEDSSDMTINTKLAMQDVDAMFNSPLPFEEHKENSSSEDNRMLEEKANIDQRLAVNKSPGIGFQIYSDGNEPRPMPQDKEKAAIINPYSMEVRVRVEESLAEWFAQQGNYYVVDIAPEIEVGRTSIIGEELRSDGVSVAVQKLRSDTDFRFETFRRSRVYDVSVDDARMTMIVQNPADPWELYLLRQLSRQSQGISIPRAVGLYDAESKSYLLCSAYPNLSLSQIYQNERLSKALLCFVVAEVLAILENCHACGIIHGALTSDTILLKGTSIHDAGTVVNHQIYEHGEVVHGQSLKSKRAVCV